MPTRADRHNNPTAFTVAIARQAELLEGVEFVPGDLFPGLSKLRTARLLRDPIGTTIHVIDRIGFHTRSNKQRWSYIALPRYLWIEMELEAKVRVIRWMYQQEKGTELYPLFDDWIAERKAKEKL